MKIWRKDNPNADTSAYNAAYVRTYASLTGFSDKEDQPQPGFFDEGDDGRRWIVSEKTPPPKYEFTPGRRAPKHRPQTKGAFGKPKHLRNR